MVVENRNNSQQNVVEKHPHTFQNWNTAKHAGFRTRNQWLLEDRKVKDREKSSGKFLFTEQIDPEVEKLNFLDDYLVSEGYWSRSSIPLYHVSQTKPAKIQQRTKDYVYLSRLLNPLRTCHIHPSDGEWKTINAGVLQDRSPWLNGEFTLECLKAHVNCRDIYGIFSEESELVWMDIDFHKKGSPEAFLAGLRVILDNLPDLLAILRGRRVFHQITNKNAGGIHTGFRLPGRKDTEKTERKVQEWLGSLAGRHPEIHDRWVESGLKAWATTEVYPNTHNGSRLPLCVGRTMLIDRPLPLLQGGRHNGMHDLVSFMAYLNGTVPPMGTQEVIDYLSARLREPTGPITLQSSVKKPAVEKKTSTGGEKHHPKSSSHLSWKGRTRSNLIRYWTGQHNPGGVLNEVIGVHTRFAPHFLPDQQQHAQEILENYVEELPEDAWHCSGRLESQNNSAIFEVINRCLDSAYSGNKNQKDAVLSAAKIEEAVAWWNKSGFNPFDKATWHEGESPVRFSVEWNENDLEDFEHLKRLFGREQQVDPAVLVNRCLELVLLKKKTCQGIALNYWKIFFEEKFGLSCGDTAVRRHQAIVQELLRLNLLEVSQKALFRPGGNSGRAACYDFGSRVVERKGWQEELTVEERLARIIAA